MRHFDKSYLLLIFPVARMCLPWLQFRTKAILVVPFILLWFLYNLAGTSSWRPRGWYQLRASFWLVLALSMFYTLLPFIYGIEGVGRIAFSWYNFCSNIIMNLTFLVILYCSMVRGKIKELKFIGLLMMALMIYNGAAAALVGSQIETGAARVLVGAANGHMDSDDFMYDAQLIVDAGMAGYDYMYIYAFLVPGFLYAAWMVKTKKMKVFFLIVALANLSSIRNGGLQTPLLVVALGCMTMLLGICFRLKKTLLVIGLVACALLFVYIDHPKIFSPLAAPLTYLADHTERGVYKGRLKSMADAVRGDENTYAVARYRLQKQSLTSFYKNNWLIGGGNSANEGGHSMLCDNLAFYGLVGLMIIVMFFVAYVQFFKRLGVMALGTKWLAMVYCYIGMFLFAAIANPVSLCYGQLYIIFPILALYFPDCKLNIQGHYQWARSRLKWSY